MNTSSRKLKSKKGAGPLIAIVLATGILTAIIASIMTTSISEYVMNERSFIVMEAENTNANVINMAVAEVVSRWKQAVNFDPKEFSTDPLIVLPEYIDFLTNAPPPASSEKIPFNIDSIGVLLSPVKGPYFAHIPENAGNPNPDPQAGQIVLIRDINIFAKSVGIPKVGDQPIVVYAKRRLEIRDAPVFNHGVFYNMNLEFHPGPPMDMFGPVHTNGDLYVTAYNTLRFHDSVTSSGKFIHGFSDAGNRSGKSYPGQVFFKGGIDGTNTSNVIFKHNYNSGPTNQAGSYYDSNHADWENIARNTWRGNVLDSAFDVNKARPLGLGDYEKNDPDSDAPLNYAYALIERNRGYPNGLNPQQKTDWNAKESQKYAQKAGLIIHLRKKQSGQTLGSKEYSLSNHFYVYFTRLNRTSAAPNASPLLDANGGVSEEKIAVDSSFVNDVFEMEEYAESGQFVTSGIFDVRRDEGISTLIFNVGAFRKGVDDNDGDYDPSVWGSQFTPEDNYNGTVYVEFPDAKGSKLNGVYDDRNDDIIVSEFKMGLVVENGSTVPNPAYNEDTELRDSGFTLATNNTMYLQGHYNADGNVNTPSEHPFSERPANYPDNPPPGYDSLIKQNKAAGGDPLASLAADTITILSENWNQRNCKYGKRHRSAVFNEVNAAVITGLTPTGKGGDVSFISGGNHNLLRFLEDWTNVTFRYRGSLVALYETELAINSNSTAFYSPPDRQFGFYAPFYAGKLPPATPNVRTFRLFGYESLSELDYCRALKDEGLSDPAVCQ